MAGFKPLVIAGGDLKELAAGDSALSGVVSSLPTPTSGLAGAILRLSTDNKPYWCNGAAWFDLSAPVITVSSSAPGSPALNDLWVQIP